MEATLLNLFVQLTPSLIIWGTFVVRLEGKINLLSQEVRHLDKRVEQSLLIHERDIVKLNDRINGHDRCLGKLIEFINIDRAAHNQATFKVSKYDLED